MRSLEDLGRDGAHPQVRDRVEWQAVMRVRFATLASLAVLLAGCSPEGAGLASAESPGIPKVQGFVVTDFTFDQPQVAQSAACPEGFNQNEREFYLAGLTPDEQTLVVADLPEGFDYLRMVDKRGGPDPCADPTAFDDPDHLTVEGSDVAIGFDLDGVASTGESPQPGACPHQDFSSTEGAPGIDNALWRVLGCIEGYQRGNTIDEYAIENIKSGGRTILIEITDLDDLRDDSDVGLGIYSSPDAIPASADGRLLAGGSLGVAEKLIYRTTARGSLAEGVLTAGPMDVRLDFDGQFLDSELHLREAQIRLEFTPDGGLQGLLGGYWDVDGFYDTYARQATRSGAYTVGFRCPAMREALARTADRYPHPETGACTAVSTAFRIQAIPAFVVEPPSSSTTHASAGPGPAAY